MESNNIDDLNLSSSQDDQSDTDTLNGNGKVSHHLQMRLR